MSAFDTISFVILFILPFIFLIWLIRNLLLSPEERRKKEENFKIGDETGKNHTGYA